jgi:hypothetical protein
VRVSELAVCVIDADEKEEDREDVEDEDRLPLALNNSLNSVLTQGICITSTSGSTPIPYTNPA